MISEGDKLRERLKELVDLMNETTEKNEYEEFYKYQLEYEDTIHELNLLERSHHYYIEK